MKIYKNDLIKILEGIKGNPLILLAKDSYLNENQNEFHVIEDVVFQNNNKKPTCIVIYPNNY